MLKFTEGTKTPGITSKKNIVFPEVNKLLAGDFRANLHEKKKNAYMVQFTERWNWKWIA